MVVALSHSCRNETLYRSQMCQRFRARPKPGLQVRLWTSEL